MPRAGAGACATSTTSGALLTWRSSHAAENLGPACGMDDGEGDYLNCPMTGTSTTLLRRALDAESATVHDFDKEKFFEGCLRSR